MTQNKMILKALQAGARLSPLDALNLFGCFRLGARIYDLKKMGYRIESEMKHNYDTGKTYSVYWLGKDGE